MGMNFILDPPSGHTNSYLDIKFSVSFDKCEEAEIKFYNNYSKQQIDILSTSNGYIRDEKIICVKNSNKIDGFFNLFNRDKLNKILSDIPGVEIVCSIKSKINDQWTEQSSSVFFYNESKSLDHDIIPFDLNIQTRDVDGSSAFLLSVVSDFEKKYEISIQSESSPNNYTFEFVAKNGRIDLQIPSEILMHELSSTIKNKFNIYWTKFEGTTNTKTMSRKYIKIPHSEFFILPRSEFKLKPQERKGPSNSNLPKEFVLSDRYFVHTYKNYSGFGSDAINSSRIKKLSLLLNESQAIQSAAQVVSAFSEDKSLDIKNSIRQSNLLKTNRNKKIQRFGISNQKGILGNFYQQYSGQAVQTFSAPSSNSTSIKKDCGCSRKKR